MRVAWVLGLLLGCASPKSIHSPSSQSSHEVPSSAPTLVERTVDAGRCRPTASAESISAAEDQLAFERAETTYEAFRMHQPENWSVTTEAVAAVIAEIIERADSAQGEYYGLAPSDSDLPLAARVRIGDIQYFRAIKLVQVRLQTSQGLAVPLSAIVALEDEASLWWRQVVAVGQEQCISNAWTALAYKRLHDHVSHVKYPWIHPSLVRGTNTP